MRLIDTHCHLYYEEKLGDPHAAIQRALEAGVDRMICIGTNAETSRSALAFADQYDGIYAVVGWHPTEAASFTEAGLAEIRELAAHPKVVAIGEIGFDFYWDYATPAEQEVCFAAQYELAQQLGKPLVYHCREAYPHMLARPESLPRHPGLFHCFGGDSSEAVRALELGCWFGVDGPLTYPKNIELRDLFASLPRDRVVIETDAPFLAPQKFRGKPNEPAYVAHVNAKLAEVWGVSEEECAQITTANAERYFGLS